MSVIKEDLFAHLTANVGATIYPIFAPTSAVFPYVLYERDSNTPVEYMAGVSEELKTEGFSLIAFGANQDATEILRDEIISAMKTLNRLIVGGTNFKRVFLTSDIDNFETKGLGDETPNYSVTLNYTIWFGLL